MKKLKFLAITIVVGFTAACSSDFLEETTGKSNLTNEDSLMPEASMQSEAYESYETLMGLLAAQTRSADKNTSYPEYYGGSYVNEEGQLVVLTTNVNESKAEVKRLKSKLANDVIYKDCKYSYNELNEIVAQLTQLAQQTPFMFEKVGMFGVDDEHNCVRVFLYHNTPSAIRDFKNSVLDTPTIEFAECSKLEDNNLSCADSVGTIKSTKRSRASVGYRAKDKNGNYGIVTAGHFISAGGKLCDPITFTTIGECLSSRLDDGTVDAAFCKITSSNYAPTNRIAYMTNPAVDTLSVDLAQPPQNLYVNMIGMTSKRQSGKVLYNSMNVLDSNKKVILTDVIAAGYKTDHGDSGGIVYALTSSTNKRSTVGINKGYSEVTVNNVKTPCGICIKAYLINQTLNLQRY